MAQGKNYMKSGETLKAANSFSKACEILTSKDRDWNASCPPARRLECGDAFFFYGKALIELFKKEHQPAWGHGTSALGHENVHHPGSEGISGTSFQCIDGTVTQGSIIFIISLITLRKLTTAGRNIKKGDILSVQRRGYKFF